MSIKHLSERVDNEMVLSVPTKCRAHWMMLVSCKKYKRKIKRKKLLVKD